MFATVWPVVFETAVLAVVVGSAEPVVLETVVRSRWWSDQRSLCIRPGSRAWL
jgi:hypothetical protein